MGYEVKYVFHPKKKEGLGYDMEILEEKVVKVGKAFDDTPLETLAASVMSQMARRDVLVVDVQPVELVRKEVSFKECSDGRGIVIKGRKFSFNEAAQMVAEDGHEEQALACHPHELASSAPSSTQLARQPHEVNQSLDDLYSNPNRAVPVKSGQPRVPVNQKKTLYRVLYDPAIHLVPEARRRNLRFTVDREYSVHQVVPHPTGRLDLQEIVVTDDTGKPIQLDEKFFTTAGQGLFGDRELGFSGSNGRTVRKPKLAFEDEMYTDGVEPSSSGGAIHQGIPIDDGSIPDNLLKVPDIRAGKPRR